MPHLRAVSGSPSPAFAQRTAWSLSPSGLPLDRAGLRRVRRDLFVRRRVQFHIL